MGDPPVSEMEGAETIVAISTPPGRGGIGIVRLSGPGARGIAEPLLRLRHPLAPGQARFAEVLDAVTREPLDQAVATFFAGPHSATGEDVVEIAAHGSPVLLDAVVRGCMAQGARLAEPGEFTQRAFLNGRIDLTQAEAIHDLIQSSTLHQARIAARQMGGALSGQVAPVKSQLISLIAELEAGIDFAEDDLDLLPEEAIAGRMEAIEPALAALERSYTYGRVLREGFSLAIVGHPNVGKSSLFNRLIERDRAIVTATAGTTRDLVTERFSIDGIPIDLIDTAGLRHTTDEAESLGIAKSHQAIAEADLILLILDASEPANELDPALLPTLENRPTLVVLNKCDLAAGDFAGLGGESPLRTSALTGAGIPELRGAILARVAGAAPSSESPLLTSLRQHQAVSTALASLERAKRANAAAIPHEMLLLDLHEALQALDSLTGATTPDDILHLIFSTFCIGK